LDPEGRQSPGRGQIEIFLNGKYAPYGFGDMNESGGLSGRGGA
jgi:hypothetical protein